MAYIPKYNMQPLKSPFENTAPMEYLTGMIQKRQKEFEEGNRLKRQQIMSALGELEISELIGKQNSNQANTYYNEIIDELTNSMMYQRDPVKGYSTKRKESSFFGPRIDDSEYDLIMQKITAADKEITKLRKEEAQIKQVSDAIKNNPGKYNLQQTQANIERYWNTGELSDQMLAFNYDNADKVLGSLDFRDAIAKQPTVTRDPNNPDRSITIYPSLPEKDQKETYAVAMANDFMVQGSVINDMVRSDDAIDKLAVEISPDNPEIARGEAERQINDFIAYGKRTPELAEAAASWGYENEYYKKIGKGNTVTKYDRPRAGDGDSEDNKTAPTYRPISYEKQNYSTDKSIRIGKDVSNLRLPDDAMLHIASVPGFGSRQKSAKGVTINKAHIADYDAVNDKYIVFPYKREEYKEGRDTKYRDVVDYDNMYLISGKQGANLGLDQTKVKSLKREDNVTIGEDFWK